jgi:hypothetical protein
MDKDTERNMERYGQTWSLRENYTRYWVSTKGRPVSVFPASGDVTDWLVVDGFGKSHRLIGDDAGERAFAIGEAFTRQ